MRAGTFNHFRWWGGHTALAVMLLARWRELDPGILPSIKAYYKHIWDLFYLEYVMYTLT